MVARIAKTMRDQSAMIERLAKLVEYYAASSGNYIVFSAPGPKKRGERSRGGCNDTGEACVNGWEGDGFGVVFGSEE